MELWAFVLAADREYDLTGRTVFRAWLERFPSHDLFGRGIAPFFSGQGIDPFFPEDKWDNDHVAEWVKGVRSLRSLARRLRDVPARETRPPGIDEYDADECFRWCIEGLRPQVECIAGSSGLSLSRKTFKGIRLWPQFAFSLPDSAPRHARESALLHGSIEAFWQATFLSMVSQDVAPVCRGCGEPLGRTPKGRVSRAEHCAKCRYKTWEMKQSRAAIRERNRRHKASERRRLKEDRS